MRIKNIIIIILTFMISAVIRFISLAETNSKNIDSFSVVLNTPSIQVIKLNGKYIEYGVTTLLNNRYVESKIDINTDDIDFNNVGTYKVKYTVNYEDIKETIYREVKIIDTESPTIKLNGSNNINLLIDEDYDELGYTAEDNYDKDITNNVEIINDLDTEKEGTYEIVYKVKDSSNNEAIAKRTVTVNPPLEVITSEENKDEVEVTSVSKKEPNSIIKNNFTNTGFYLEGHINNNNGTYKIKIVNTTNNAEKIIDMTKIDDISYKGNIDIKDLENGTYKLYINSEELVNKMDSILRIRRAKILDKLVTINYDNDITSMKIEDFNYTYDILIDVGHGGSDPGTSNVYMQEKDLNLLVSSYEKCRYIEHGLNVYMTRVDDSLSFLGDSSWTNLRKRAYTIGYYGAVSQIIYSNHHNSNGQTSTTTMGFEILTPASYTFDELKNEHDIASKFYKIYNLTETHNRFYARNYDTDAIFSTLDGQTYTFTDYYAVIRIPYLLFNTKVVIYEGIYMNNIEDYNWYVNDKNFYKVSEAKIKTYVESLGKTYIDDTNCK